MLNVTDTIPKSDVGREYYLQNVDKKVLVCEGVVCDVCEGMMCEGVMCGVWYEGVSVIKKISCSLGPQVLHYMYIVL